MKKFKQFLIERNLSNLDVDRIVTQYSSNNGLDGSETDSLAKKVLKAGPYATVADVENKILFLLGKI